jgi:hypothetical protein
LIDGADAPIVKFKVNSNEPFQETRMLQFPGEDAGGLPAILTGHQKHRAPLEGTASQVPD